MTMDTPARRLLAGLVDEQGLETEPIAEVRADLAALGVDPVRSVALARRLAAGAASPAITLLGKIAEAEEDDDEIARLEHAEADSVRRRVGEGVAAAAIANAQRAAGGQSNVVGLRRRRPRRLLYGLGGIAVALAASVVFYVGLSPNQFERDARDKTSALQTATGTGQTTTNETGAAQVPATPPAAEPYGTVVDPQAQALPAEPAGSDAASSSQPADNLQARMQPAGKGPEVAGQTAAAPAAPQQSADSEATTRAKSEADQKQAAGIVLSAPESQLADRPTQTATSTASGTAGESNAEELRGGALANRIAGPFGLDRPVAALLIVDPKLVPAGLKQQNYPTGDLLARLGDARRLAGDRPIAALVTLQLADHTADAIVVAGAADELALRRDLDKDKTAPLASAGAGYDVIPLDGR
ncbi:MAG TPA: hypothetical protein VE914_14070 [Candidatus Angelobacter sp.]|nr:hypothetical protein [Candidatus Angelobacter sp.]